MCQLNSLNQNNILRSEVNEGISLILVIQTFSPFSLSVLYNKDVYISLSNV